MAVKYDISTETLALIKLEIIFPISRKEKQIFN